MENSLEGNAIVFCEGAFCTTNGKTAHGLVRYTKRYRILSVIDSRYAGRDAGEILDGRPKGIPIYNNLTESVKASNKSATHLVIGVAPDGGRLAHAAREEVKNAVKMGLNVDSGLHDFLSDDTEISKLVKQHRVKIRDVRKPPPKEELHFFSGKIKEVASLKVAILGSDSAVGKRTTAWLLVEALKNAGFSSEMIGTGQTAWMQGARYCVIIDSLINDFVSGEIEHAVWSAWRENSPDVIVIEGQGSLMNPAYPGGFEIIAAGRPDLIILQHAPGRKEYDGFPGYLIHPLSRQIQAIEIISGKHVAAIAINHEGLSREEVPWICDAIKKTIDLPAFDPLLNGAEGLVKVLSAYLNTAKKSTKKLKERKRF